MAKKTIGRLLGHPIVVGDRNLVRPNEIYAITDAESDDVVVLQMMSRTTGKFYDIMRYSDDAAAVRTITTDEPSGSATPGTLETEEKTCLFNRNNAERSTTVTPSAGKLLSKVTIRSESPAFKNITVTANGVYDIEDEDNLNILGFGKVVVDVPQDGVSISVESLGDGDYRAVTTADIYGG